MQKMKVRVAQSFLTPCIPKYYTVHGFLQARILEWVAFPLSRGSSQPRDWPRSPTLQADSLPAEAQEKLKNTGVGSLFLLQRIFLTQELTWGLLHCRRILYQLNYPGIPKNSWEMFKRGMTGTSLVVQWWRSHLPVQETQVQSLIGEGLTGGGTTKHMHHNYWACALKLESGMYRAHALQLLKPM